mmetsp:Transcript_40652/g.98228  ORF Transcript_40652/g.98228 Transcript_40652/m.98228 type:complete len:138 (+) Transcript_40652:102-515(+)|eukprot:CAMPEP_0113641656 /NCGR_PEP_ID=MMETSP0017_2-20120614/21872_1 /TAXON_ID=2856 /ORGANISM="Cylindrotheca closterium" /LENGTH=137 /DNA_ID=CAMNT_0000553017 /DNA_START=18 /DNA_END=431 /DNA_ORIENTATION=+ /assembly_acc=CAM_ASM_000147
MANILLTCSSEDFDVALCLKSSIKRELGIHVSLHVEDDSDDEDGDLDELVELATVLLVFEFGDSNISAWVTIDGMDIAHSNYEETPFPEAIDFSENLGKGIAILDNILYEDFGLDLRPPVLKKSQRFTSEQLEPLTV